MHQCPEILERSAEGVVVTDTRPRILFVNEAFTRITGYSPEEALGRNPSILKSGMQDTAYYEELWATITAGRVWRGELFNRKKDGSVYAEDLTITPVRDPRGVIVNYIAVLHDVSEQRAAQHAQRLLASIVEAMQDSIISTTPEGVIVSWNRGAEEMYGYQAAEAVGKPVSILLPPEELHKLPLMMEPLNQGRSLSQFECTAIRKDGSRLEVSLSLTPIRDSSGRVIATAGIARDITARQQWMRTQSFLASIVESSDDAIIGVSSEGVVLSWNRGAEALYGYPAQEVIGGPISIFVAPEQREEQRAILARVIGGESVTHLETKRRRKDGSEIEFSANLSPIRNSHGAVVGCVLIGRDLAERKRAEALLREREQLFRTAFRDAPFGMCLTALDGHFLQVNPPFCRMLGYSEQDLLSLTWAAITHPEDAPTSREQAERLVSHPQRPVEFEKRYVRKDGRSIWVSIKISLGLDAKDRPSHYVVHTEDITERKRAAEELLQAKEAAEAASRAKSEFLANMSHEIRTPMNGIIGMTELALETNLTTEQRDCLQTAMTSAHSLLAIIDDVLDFSRMEAHKLELENSPFDLKVCVDSAVKSLAIRAGEKGLDLILRAEPGLPQTVKGDPGRLRQILVNLAGNAIKFTERGEVAVRVEKADGSLHFSVADTGIGIPLEKQQSIFDGFVQADGSATRKFGGAGLGLSICSRLVQLMGGRMWLESEPGHGSTFHFTIPSAECAFPRLPSPPAVGVHRKTVLVVDDNPVNQRLAVRLVEKQGYGTFSAPDGQAALEALSHRHFDLVLMDVQMPVMDGLAATAAIRERERKTGEHLPIVAITAHALPGDRERCLAAGMDGYLAKPIHAQELAAALERFTSAA